MSREESERLKDSFAEVLRAQAEEAIDIARDAGDDPDLLDAVVDILERLAQSARSLDLAQVLDAADDAARAIRAGQSPHEPLAVLLDRCRALGVTAPFLRPIVLVTPSTPALRTQIATMVAPFEVVDSTDEAIRRSMTNAPAALVVPETDIERCHTECPPDMLVYAWGGPHDVAARVRAARLGVAGFVMPYDLRGVLARVRYRLATVSSGTYRITLFEPPGDTPFAKLLAGSGIEVDLVTDPRQLLARIDASPPNLVVIEMSARGARAQDFLALVRGHGRWSDLPVALVASDVPSEMEALRADADAVLRRDADPALVRARLRAVLDRLRRERQLRSTDTHLGVLTRTAFLRAADREIAVARRTRQPLTVARVDSDPRNRAPSDVALRPLAAALSTGIRWTDTVGLVGESGLGVLMPSCTADQARSRLTPLLARAAAPETPCIGLADTTAVVEDVLVRADRELLAVRKR